MNAIPNQQFPLKNAFFGTHVGNIPFDSLPPKLKQTTVYRDKMFRKLAVIKTANYNYLRQHNQLYTVSTDLQTSIVFLFMRNIDYLRVTRLKLSRPCMLEDIYIKHKLSLTLSYYVKLVRGERRSCALAYMCILATYFNESMSMLISVDYSEMK